MSRRPVVFFSYDDLASRRRAPGPRTTETFSPPPPTGAQAHAVRRAAGGATPVRPPTRRQLHGPHDRSSTFAVLRHSATCLETGTGCSVESGLGDCHGFNQAVRALLRSSLAGGDGVEEGAMKPELSGGRPRAAQWLSHSNRVVPG